MDFRYGSAGKESPAMWETWLRSLGREDPLEKGKAMYSSILAWRIPWTVTKNGVHGVTKNWTCKWLVLKMNSIRLLNIKIIYFPLLFVLLVSSSFVRIACASLVAQLVRNPPAMQETLVWFLGWEDLLEKG